MHADTEGRSFQLSIQPETPYTIKLSIHQFCSSVHSTLAQGQPRYTENEAHVIRDPLWKVWLKELAEHHDGAVKNLVLQGETWQ